MSSIQQMDLPAPPTDLPLPDGVNAGDVIRTTWKEPRRIGEDPRNKHIFTAQHTESHISRAAAHHPKPIQGMKLPEGTHFYLAKSADPRDVGGDQRGMPDVDVPHAMENTVLYVPKKESLKDEERHMFNTRFVETPSGEFVDVVQAETNARIAHEHLAAHQAKIQQEFEDMEDVFHETIHGLVPNDESLGKQTVMIDQYSGEKLICFKGKIYPRERLDEMVGNDPEAIELAGMAPTFDNDSANLRFELFPFVDKTKPTKPIDIKLYESFNRSNSHWSDQNIEFVETETKYVTSGEYPEMNADPWGVLDDVYDSIFGN